MDGGRSRRRARLPGRHRRRPHHHARPRRLRYVGGRARRRAEGRSLRHLHRRRRRLHHRSAHRREGAQAREDLLRRDAGDGVARRQGAADALGRAGVDPARAGARAVEFVEPGAPCPARWSVDEDEIVEKQVGRPGVAYSRDEAKITLLGVRRSAGRRRRHLRPARRRQRQRRHDRAERVADGRSTDITFTCPARPGARRRAELRRPKPRSVRQESPADANVAKVSVDRHRHAQPRRRRAHHVRGPCGKGHQHRGDRDLRDQDLRADRRRSTPSSPCAPCTRLTGSTPTSVCSRALAAAAPSRPKPAVQKTRRAASGAPTAKASSFLHARTPISEIAVRRTSAMTRPCTAPATTGCHQRPLISGMARSRCIIDRSLVVSTQHLAV